MAFGELGERLKSLFRGKPQQEGESPPETVQDIQKQLDELNQNEKQVRTYMGMPDADITGSSKIADAKRLEIIEQRRKDLRAQLEAKGINPDQPAPKPEAAGISPSTPTTAQPEAKPPTPPSLKPEEKPV